MKWNYWIWVVPMLLLAGCSNSSAPEQAAAPPPAQPSAASQPASTAPGGQAPVAAVSPLGSSAPATHTPAAPAAARPAASRPAGESAAPAEAARVTIPAGTKLVVRLDEALSTKANNAGDRFTATLEQPIIVDGRTIAPRGTTCVGGVTESAASGRMEGKADLTITLDSIELD